MSIFQEVVLKLIYTVCSAHIKTSEAADVSYVGRYTRTLEVAAAKRGLLLALLNSPTLKTHVNKDDLKQLSLLQSLLMEYKAAVIKARTEKTSTGTTEELLDHLSDSLKLTYDQFNRLGLLNLKYHKDDPLTIFYVLTGIYYAKKMLRTKQQPSETSSIANRIFNLSSFVDSQESLLGEFFIHCQSEVRAYDTLISDGHRSLPMTPELSHSTHSLKVNLVLCSIYRLKEQHDSLSASYAMASLTSSSFQFFRESLSECLDAAKNELKSLYPRGSDIKPQSTTSELDSHTQRERVVTTEADQIPIGSDDEGASGTNESTRSMLEQLQCAQLPPTMQPTLASSHPASPARDETVLPPPEATGPHTKSKKKLEKPVLTLQ